MYPRDQKKPTREDHVRTLRFLRDELERSRAADTHPRASDRLTSLHNRDRFNEALLGLQDELGLEWVRLYHFGDDKVVSVPKSWPKRDQVPPGVGRGHLLLAINELLRQLGEE